MVCIEFLLLHVGLDTGKSHAAWTIHWQSSVRPTGLLASGGGKREALLGPDLHGGKHNPTLPPSAGQ